MKQTFFYVLIIMGLLSPMQLQAQALNFDGTNDHVSLPSAVGTALRSGSNGIRQTYEFWFKGSNIQSVFRVESSTGWHIRIPYNYNGTTMEHTIFNKLANNRGVAVSPTIDIHDGNWHHIAFTWASGVPMISYVDGVEVARSSTNAKNVIPPNITTTFIGSNQGLSEFTNGTIDELRIWGRVKTQAQIQDSMNIELTGNEANLIAYYKFNEGIVGGNNSSVTTLVNSSSTGATYNGTLVNFANTGNTSNWVEGAIAMNNVWTGAVSTDWNNSANWSLGIVPRTTDNISFAPNPTFQPSLSGNNTINNLSLSGSNKVVLGSNDLTVSTITGASATAYVVTDGEGSLKMQIPATTSAIFPVGTASSYDPVTVEPTTAAVFAVKVKPINSSIEFPGTITDFSKVAKKLWRITPTGNPGSTRLIFKNGGTSFTPTVPKVGHYTNANTWEELSATYTNDTWTATTTSFSPFGVGDENSFAGVVLATELVFFKGINGLAGNILSWSTAQEVDNQGFYVEKYSTDNGWENIGFVSALKKPGYYTFTDTNTETVSFYRLRQIDTDGREYISKVISVSHKEKSKWTVYPNPASDILIINGLSDENFQIINIFGQVIAQGTIASPQIDITHLTAGTYILKIGQDSHRFIKQ